ncbi:MAG TPA: hypothetical protein VF939_27450 [Puia sp.]
MSGLVVCSISFINKAHRPKKEREWLDRKPPELREEIEKYNQNIRPAG